VPDRRRPLVAVVGAGISGLSAAWALVRERDRPPRVLVLEGSERAGGRIETVHFLGRPLDTGPDAFITRSPAAEGLCRELGLGEELIAPASGEAHLYLRGRLRPLPKGLFLGIPTDLRTLRSSRLLSTPGLLRVAADLVLPGRALPSGADADPSVSEVIGRRIGGEALRVLVEPLVGGINAGATDHLSLVSALPQVAGILEGRHSLVRAARSAMAKRPAASRTPDHGDRGPSSDAPAAPKPVFLGLAGGLGTLVDRLVDVLTERGVELRLGQAVGALTATSDGYELGFGEGTTEHADAVILAIPAYEASKLLGALSPAAAGELAGVAYSSVALVTLVWPANAAGEGLPAGTGFLVPRSERTLVTACTFTSAKWPRSSVPGRLVLRASAGRAGDDRIAGLSDAELLARVRQELARILGITEHPLSSMIRRFPDSFAQYEPGHQARVTRVREALAAAGRVAVAGAAFDGIGIPACVASGERAARDVLAGLGVGTGRGGGELAAETAG
jgi:protoporphyrinogen/coproporphyrinogen III oxidase